MLPPVDVPRGDLGPLQLALGDGQLGAVVGVAGDAPDGARLGAVEGIEATPAYRGLALAVFEDLDLAEFGNRIPFLTFEVIADDGVPIANHRIATDIPGRIEKLPGVVVAGCVDPSTKTGARPHRHGTVAVRLHANGEASLAR